jgi:hypothetical protein
MPAVGRASVTVQDELSDRRFLANLWQAVSAASEGCGRLGAEVHEGSASQGGPGATR